MIYWMTGQPGAGKTTLSKLLVEHLQNIQQSSSGALAKVFHLDGDNLRALTLNQNYSKQVRLNNVNTAQKIAHYLHNEGHTVVVSLVSPYLQQREELKTMIANGIKEFYIVSNELRGREQFHVQDYEPPVDNFILIDTTQDTEDQSLNKMLEHLK
jgi:adenylylsulfate kinase-like enzyme